MDKYSQKDTFTFPHDANAAGDHKCIDLIEKLGPEGYGIYWLLIESLRREPNFRIPLASLPGLARHYNSTPEKFKAVVSGFKLFKADREYFWSESLIRRMAEREDFHISMTVLAYKKYKKDPPPDKLVNHARALLTHYGGTPSGLPALSDGSVSALHKISKAKQSQVKLSEVKLSEEKNAVIGGMGGNVSNNVLANYQGKAAAALSDTFKLFFDNTRKDFLDLDYEIEFKKFFQFWNEGKAILKRPNQAWLNWLTKAREIKNRDRGNGNHKDQAPANSNMADLINKIEANRTADNG